MSDAEEPKIETWEEAADAILGLFGKRFRSINVDDTEELKDINPGKGGAVITTEAGSPFLLYASVKQLLNNHVSNAFWFNLLGQWVEQVAECEDCFNEDGHICLTTVSTDLCEKHRPKSLEDLKGVSFPDPVAP